MKKEIQAIVVLPAGIKQDCAGKWVSTDLSCEDDKWGAPGGKLRVLAASILSKKYPNARVVASGGLGYDVPPGTPVDRPMLSEILLDELIAQGLSRDHILLECNSNTTYQNIQEIVRLDAKEEFKKVIIVTSRYHVRRLKAILAMKFPDLLNRLDLTVAEAEEILIAHDPSHWKEMIDTVYQSDFMIERMKKEERGLSQILDGTYQFR